MNLNDYYQILELKYKFTAWTLFNKYLYHTKIALQTKNPEALINIRKGFEVLRNDESRKSYERLYRKYILMEELNFPEIREQSMINEINEKETNAIQVAEESLRRNETYGSLLYNWTSDFIFFDLRHLIGYRRSGIVLFIPAIALPLTNLNQGTIVGSLGLLLVGILFLRWNFIEFILTE